MVDVRNLVEEAADAVARAFEPLTRVAANTADTGASIAASQGMQVTEAVADALASALRALPDKLRDLEVPRAKRSLDDIGAQLGKIAARLRRLSQELGVASTRLREPALQTSGMLIVDGFDAAAAGARFLRPAEQGLIRLLPRAITRPYIDGITTIHLGLSTASDLARVCVSSLPDLGEGLGDVAEDLGRAAELLDATGKTIRDLSELVPI